MPRDYSTRFKKFAAVIYLVVILVGLELGLQLVHLGVRFWQRKPSENLLMAYLQDKQLAQEIWRETWTPMRHRGWHQFLGWSAWPQTGRHVNIDAQSGRQTWNPAFTPGQAAPSLYMFGGSALFGVGARDAYTIPSRFSHLLADQGYRFQVFNYGEPGYTFTQGVLHLTLMLREGRRPAHVIFYEGFNDLYAAHQHGRAGTVHNIAMTKDKLELRYRGLVWNSLVEGFRKYCMTYRAINGAYLYFHPEAKFQEVAATYSPEQLTQLAKEVAEDFRATLGLLDRLSQAYGFRYLVFWQPCIFTEERRLPQEAHLDPRLQDQSFGRIAQETVRFLREQPLPHFYILTGALQDRSQALYFDTAHLLEPGNELVAENMFRIFQQEFLAPRN
jgi:lysophospholipase L1-like esterase